MEPPLYVEVSPLLSTAVTGMARFAARAVEALNRTTSVRMFTTIPAREIAALSLRRGLVRGEEIGIARGGLPPADHDLEAWLCDLLRRPRERPDAGAARVSPCLYLQLRPDERHFAREVSVLYDFTPLILPGAHVPKTRDTFGRFFSLGVACSDKAVAISQSTRADARWLCSLPPEDVTVAYPGPSLCERAHAWAEPVTRSDRLVLVVSTREPRKNAAFLADWFLTTDALRPDTELWWVGPEGWLWKKPRTGLARRRTRRGVRFLGAVSDRQLCELYRRATFTIYPSLYEGFGFPVLDSLLHGTPVVCSFNSSLKEFAGPGVWYFDPYEAASLDHACRELLAAPPATVERPDLRTRCSWDTLAQTVLELCNS